MNSLTILDFGYMSDYTSLNLIDIRTFRVTQETVIQAQDCIDFVVETIITHELLEDFLDE